MSPKTGRPTDNPKSNRVEARLSDEELKKLNICCEKTGLSKSEVIIRGIQTVYEELKEK